jgi:hypothetical protein
VPESWAPHARITSRSENHQEPPATITPRPMPRTAPVRPPSSPPQETIETLTAPIRTTYRTVFSIAGPFSVEAVKSASGSTGPGWGPSGPTSGRSRRRREWRAAVIFDEVPLELRVRHEAQLAARALMNGHDLVLNFGTWSSSNPCHVKSPWLPCARSVEIPIGTPDSSTGNRVKSPDVELGGEERVRRFWPISWCGNDVHIVSTSRTHPLHCAMVG